LVDEEDDYHWQDEVGLGLRAHDVESVDLEGGQEELADILRIAGVLVDERDQEEGANESDDMFGRDIIHEQSLQVTAEEILEKPRHQYNVEYQESVFELHSVTFYICVQFSFSFSA
jgi:hypothetical protein